MNNLIELLEQLVRLAASLEGQAQTSPEIVYATTSLIKYIQGQNGMTTDQILAMAGVTLDEMDLMLLEDRIRLGVDATKADLGGDETKEGY